jgi:predicted DNA-binding transcriptional regulator AlpA
MQSPEVLCPPFHAEFAFIRKKKLLEIVPFSAATLHRLIRANKFPRQRKISERVSVWSTSEVYEFLESKGGVK